MNDVTDQQIYDMAQKLKLETFESIEGYDTLLSLEAREKLVRLFIENGWMQS